MNRTQPGGQPPRAPERTFDHQHIWHLDHAGFTAATRLLLGALYDERIDVVLGIHRGGTPLAAALAAGLGRPHLTVRARHNRSDDLYQPATGAVDVDLTGVAMQEQARVLVCDDLCGSGATLAAVTGAVAGSFRPASLVTAVLCRNAGAARPPDLWLWDVRDWVVFPWEPPPGQPTVVLPKPTRVRRSGP